MKYSFVYQKKTYELPAYNVEMVRKLETLDEQCVNISRSEQVQLLYNYVNDTLGEEVTKELLSDFENSDPNEVNVIYSSIVNAYNKPLEQYELKERESEMKENFKAVQSEKIVDLMNALSKASEMAK